MDERVQSRWRELGDVHAPRKVSMAHAGQRDCLVTPANLPDPRPSKFLHEIATGLTQLVTVITAAMEATMFKRPDASAPTTVFPQVGAAPKGSHFDEVLKLFGMLKARFPTYTWATLDVRAPALRCTPMSRRADARARRTTACALQVADAPTRSPRTWRLF